MTQSPGPAVTDTFASVARKQVTGAEVPGWIDRDAGRPVFTPWSRRTYLVLDDGFLRMDAVGTTGRLALAEVPTVEPFPGVEDLEEEFATAQVRDLLLGEDTDRRLVRVRYARNADARAQRDTVSCVEFTFAPNEVLCADPWWTFGIRLGGEGVYDRWIAGMADSPAGPFTEQVWEP